MIGPWFTSLEPLRQAMSWQGSGPALVMGSAPTAVVPAGYDQSWRLFCMNGSQAVAARLGLPPPNVVLLRGRLFGDKQVDREAVEVLRGLSAQVVLVQNSGERPTEIVDRLAEISYAYETVRFLSRQERNALIYRAFNNPLHYFAARKSISAGVVTSMLALTLRHGPVVLSGISLRAGGHFYSASNLPRHHVEQDRKVLQILVRRGFPIFAADTALASDSGLPEWQGPR